jgi:alkanesulfonate monooxygenase SsuD/methylene tetrahydromethanopterin reductase-like flavin-dependent oxidoreductase (luciferase family)
VDIGIGIPNTVLDTPGALLIEWSRRAEARGFVSLATIGRIAYPAHDELIGLTAAAGATERIGLFTNILLVPAFPLAVLAKQTATLASASRGRFTLGAGVGTRPDDFAASASSFQDRGRRSIGSSRRCTPRGEATRSRGPTTASLHRCRTDGYR